MTVIVYLKKKKITISHSKGHDLVKKALQLADDKK